MDINLGLFLNVFQFLNFVKEKEKEKIVNINVEEDS